MHRRSVIYLGPGEIRARDETRPSLFTDPQVSRHGAQAGVQINAIATSPASTGSLPSHRGSHRRAVLPVTILDSDLVDPAGRIRGNPPGPRCPAAPPSPAGWDSPNVPLVVAVVVSTLLCVSLVVLRR